MGVGLVGAAGATMDVHAARADVTAGASGERWAPVPTWSSRSTGHSPVGGELCSGVASRFLGSVQPSRWNEFWESIRRYSHGPLRRVDLLVVDPAQHQDRKS